MKSPRPRPHGQAVAFASARIATDRSFTPNSTGHTLSDHCFPMLEKNRMQLFRSAQAFLDEPAQQVA
jgi:hypothetical protein